MKRQLWLTFSLKRLLLTALLGAGAPALFGFFYGVSPVHNAGALQAAPNPGSRFKLNGEYGLWVEESDRQITVHWLTQAPDSGFLQARRRDLHLHSFKTPADYAHQVTFPTPGPENDPITIYYGSLTDSLDRHATTVMINRSDFDRQSRLTDVDSVFVVGDVHGQYNTLAELLRNAGLLDEQGNWRPRQAHLVVMGDIFDRGHDVIKTLWFLYKLERQAKQRGSRVHILLGNHEIMVFLNDLRYTSGKEKLIAQYHQTSYSRMFDLQRSVLGRWLSTKPGILKIDQVLFAHGGVAPPFTEISIPTFNDSLQAFLQEAEFTSLLAEGVSTVRGNPRLYARRLFFFFGEQSVFWHRDYVLSDTLEKELEVALDRFDVRHHVVSHTPVPSIRSFYGEKVIAVDLHRPASEMLLLVNTGRRLWKYRYRQDGSKEPL